MNTLLVLIVKWWKLATLMRRPSHRAVPMTAEICALFESGRSPSEK